MSETQVMQANQQHTPSQRFTQKIISEFSNGVGELALTDFQRRLVQNYFVAIDGALKLAESKRLEKPEKKRDPLAITWQNVDMEQLARTVVAAARIGLDPAQKNHINFIPFKNNTTNKYNITVIEGYRGLELKAMKYGLDIPDAVTVELVYKNDTFRVIKKDSRNPVEKYEFEVTNPFDRGDIVGGFYYHQYEKNPAKNRLVVMSLQEILKRKPKYASPEFWGGERAIWEDGKKTGTEQVEGWFEKMCWKTVYRAAYSDITIDSQKIDTDYLHLKRMEDEYEAAMLQEEIRANANREVIDIVAEEPAFDEATEANEALMEDTVTEEDAAAIDSVQEELPLEQQTLMKTKRGPSFA